LTFNGLTLKMYGGKASLVSCENSLDLHTGITDEITERQKT